MEYNKLVAVTGLPGLFELINSKSDGAIIRSLADNSTRFASSRIHNFTHLESIEIYTTGENVNLVEVLQAMDKEGGKLPDEKDPAAVKKYFEKVYPEMDFERVYASDMKKMVKWFDVMKKNNVEMVLPEPPEEEPAEEEIQAEAEVPKPAKKTAAKKEDSPVEEKKAAPKKTARKKKAE